MQQRVEEATIEAEARQIQPSPTAETASRKRDPAAPWRAVAGMALSVALACLIVMLEFTGQAAHRAARMHRRADSLLSRVYRLDAEVLAERVRTAAARHELAAAEALRVLLRAPDVAMLLLSPPAAGGRSATPVERSVAMLALSPGEHRAILMVTGLKPPAADTTFVLWWNASHSAPIRAAEFRTEADGSALVTVALPPVPGVAAAMVTAEPVASADRTKAAAAAVQTGPSGPVQLRGTLAR
jgi:Anti-sigma-K factor rskA